MPEIRPAKPSIIIYALVSVFVGIVLLSLTLLFRLNPVDGSVVNDHLQKSPGIVYFLFITTMPAWAAGVALGGGKLLSLLLMFLFQSILYSSLGILLCLARIGIGHILHCRH